MRRPWAIRSDLVPWNPSLFTLRVLLPVTTTFHLHRQPVLRARKIQETSP